jgi:hypothetical protein
MLRDNLPKLFLIERDKTVSAILDYLNIDECIRTRKLTYKIEYLAKILVLGVMPGARIFTAIEMLDFLTPIPIK